jgi:outer membrane receptor protein involved in Fe transport
MKKTPLASAISCILAGGTLGASVPVLAQDVNLSDEPIEEVVVLGSRIKKDVFTSSAPLTVIDVEIASIQGISTVGQLLQRSTVAAGSPQVTAATTVEFVQNGGLGASTVSLRGLGANRTLVLLNGRRAGPSGVEGGVSSFDLNVLPLATIERVEILKDGASSIYGSDAVAGVVNIITRKDDGAEFDAFVSLPSESGGEESRISATYGKTFSRGNFRVTADYHKQELLARGERDYFSCGNQFIFDINSGERADVTDPRTGERWCEDLTWGHLWIYDYADPSNVPPAATLLGQYDYDNDLGAVIPAYAVDAGNPSFLTHPGGFFPVGYDRLSDGVTNDNHPFQDKQSLNPENELITLYAEAEYDLTDNVTAYAEFLLNHRETFSDYYKQYWSYIYSGDFDFFGSDGSGNDGLGTGIPAGGDPRSAAAGWFGEQWYSPTAITDRADTLVEVDYVRFVAGLKGELSNGWGWDLSVNVSDSEGEYTNDRTFADSIFDQNWAYDYAADFCEGGVTSVRGVPCIDIPWLDPQLLAGNISPELDAFLFGKETGTTDYTQWSVDGFMTGEVMDLPAGPLSVAFGFHYREDEITDTPGAITLDPVTGESNDWDGGAGGITTGDDSTKALFVELDVPLLSGKTLARNLTLNASARYTDVDSYGSDTTWKVGVNWQIVDSVRIRGNRGTSFRTPALFELYLAESTSFISQRTDPCIGWGDNLAAGTVTQTLADNCAAHGIPPDFTFGSVTPTVFSSGGLGELVAETSDSTTVGVIWQPAFADLSFSVDYFDIEVENQVDRVGGEQILLGCYNSLFGPAFDDTEPLCDLFDRTGLGMAPDNIIDDFINIAVQNNRGLDYAVRYNTEIPWGALGFEVHATRQLEDTKGISLATVEELNGRVGDPEVVGDWNVTLDKGAWSFFYGGNYIGTSSDEEHFGGNTITYRGVQYRAVLNTEAITYHSFSVEYTFENYGLTALVGVANAFDEEPPQLTREGTDAEYTMIGNAVLASQYDWLGRRFFLNLKMRFD